MKVFRCKVRLGGGLHNEVRKDCVTSPEIILLRAEHGSDAVVDVYQIADRTAFDRGEGEVRWTDAIERQRLSEMYGDDKVRRLFGPDHNPLPETFSGAPEAPSKKRSADAKPEAFME